MYVVFGLVFCGFIEVEQADLAFFLVKLKYLFVFGAISAFFYLKKYNSWLALFMSYGLILWTFTGTPTYDTIIHVFLPFFALSLAIFITDKFEEEFVVSSICNFGLFQALVGLCQFFGYYPFVKINTELQPWALSKPIGLIGQETKLGIFLVACLCPCLFKRKWFYTIIITLCAILTRSSFTFLSLGALYSLWIWDRFGFKWFLRICLIGSGLMGIIFGFYPKSEFLNDKYRFLQWGLVWESWKDSPIFGAGPAFWQAQRPEVIHNEYLSMLYHYGIVGFGIMLGFLVSFIKSFRFTWHHALCIVTMINSIGNFPLHLIPNALLFLIALLYSRPKDCYRL